MPADPSDARLTSAMLVGVLMRRCAAAGGFATVLVKGDAVSGVQDGCPVPLVRDKRDCDG